MTRLALMTLVIALGWSGLAHSAPTLDAQPNHPLVHLPRGSSVQLLGRMQNLSDEIVYVGSLGWAASPTFTGELDGLVFAIGAPDSLAPGESWQGPLVTVKVPTDTPPAALHRLDLFVHGGPHRLADELVAQFTFALDDSTAPVGAPVRAPVRALTLSASPNPSRGAIRVAFTLPAAGVVDLRVIDVGGRTVRLLEAGRFEAGEHALAWDGTDAAGAAAPPGVYFARMATAHGTKRIALHRVR